jgi:hypothetical protein
MQIGNIARGLGDTAPATHCCGVAAPRACFAGEEDQWLCGAAEIAVDVVLGWRDTGLAPVNFSYPIMSALFKEEFSTGLLITANGQAFRGL